MSESRVLVVTVDEHTVSGGLGRARAVVIAVVEDDTMRSWDVHQVEWDVAHDGADHQHHHGAILQFINAQRIDAVVTGHVGPSMLRTLAANGIMVFEQEGMPARNATRFAAAALDRRRREGGATQRPS